MRADARPGPVADRARDALGRFLAQRTPLRLHAVLRFCALLCVPAALTAGFNEAAVFRRGERSIRSAYPRR